MAKPSCAFDVAVIGAGAAGLFAASLVGAKGYSTIVLDHRERIAEKIRISGGGRCNFTNLYSNAENFLSNNRHFAKSALASYSPHDFIELVKSYNIAFHEKKLGQLFCDDSAQNIIDMLLSECQKAGVIKSFGITIGNVEKQGDNFIITTDKQIITARKLVIATGGLSIPKIGATGFGYDIARQFGLSIIKPRPALVPLTFTDHLKENCAALSGLSVEASVNFAKTSFAEGLLFTHRGLSGPSILQISSYWREGQNISVNMAPDDDVFAMLISAKSDTPRTDITTTLSQILPKRLAQQITTELSITGRLADLSDKKLRLMADRISSWQMVPAGTEGYRTAEVTLGGVDTKCLSSKDMQSKTTEGLYFIGEVMDVTGHLGGHNFQWAWASAYAMANSLP